MRILAERRIAPADRDRIESLVDKYMAMLGVEGERPVIVVKSNLGSKWLGRALWWWSHPEKAVIELQQSILSDPLTLERVIAHEVIHVADYRLLSEADIQLARMNRLRHDGHGEFFRRAAEAINTVMGPDFVTEKSDQTFAIAPTGREFYLLVLPITQGKHAGKYAFSWAGRLGPKVRKQIERKRAEGARLFRVSDDYWTKGAKIELFGGAALPHTPEREAQLADIYENATETEAV